MSKVRDILIMIIHLTKYAIMQILLAILSKILDFICINKFVILSEFNNKINKIKQNIALRSKTKEI